jgi:hypothetical protein
MIKSIAGGKGGKDGKDADEEHEEVDDIDWHCEFTRHRIALETAGFV